jgi:hypothetical protein
VENTADKPIPPSAKPMLPSAFMRGLRPQNYSDTEDRTTIVLEREVLEHHLETITNRNEPQDFELFCRKLCERTLCPNLRPATGPHGCGDSKADTETIPVAEEISALWYIGDQGTAKERWAFAFSAKKKWAEKVRSDAAGLTERNRGYSRIFCVTSQFAPDKARAKLEDELTRLYGIPITILDRSWIVKEIVENDRKDLAFDHLDVGHEVKGLRQLGPLDYSRAARLDRPTSIAELNWSGPNVCGTRQEPRKHADHVSLCGLDRRTAEDAIQSDLCDDRRAVSAVPAQAPAGDPRAIDRMQADVRLVLSKITKDPAVSA